MKWGIFGLLTLGSVAALVACAQRMPSAHAQSDALGRMAFAQGIGSEVPLAQWPKANVQRALGLRLFFDVTLSSDRRISCGVCHDPKRFFTDGQPVGVGVHGRKGTRSTPTVVGLNRAPLLFWDGRADSLEAQAGGPIENPLEMDMPLQEAVKRVAARPLYPVLFQAGYGRGPNLPDMLHALASFERAIETAPSAYERWQVGDDSALTPAQVRGQAVFARNNCGVCHIGLGLSDQSFHNTGWGLDQPKPDLGRYVVTKRPEDWGSFKTPTLRNIAQTAPYMHDGRLKTLREVVDFYDKGGHPNPNLDERMKPLNLSEQEKVELVDFLQTLTSETNFKELSRESAAVGQAPRLP